MHTTSVNSVEEKIFPQNARNTQAPRFYYDGVWKEVVQLSIEFMSNKSVSFGWHDERCAGKGVNAYVYSAQISTEMLLQFLNWYSENNNNNANKI